MKRYKVHTVECVLSQERWINLEYLLINNYDQGSLSMSFILDDKISPGFSGRVVKCKFDSCLFFNVIDEFYDANEVAYADIDRGRGESIQSKFGPVVVYEESPWIDQGDRILDFDEALPRHYLFITTDEIIEVISPSAPEFSVVERTEKTEIEINRQE